MNTICKRLSLTFIAVFSLLTVLLIPQEVSAKVTLTAKTIYTYVAPRNGYTSFNLNGAVLKSVKYSKKGVIKISDGNVPNYNPLKAGKTTVTYTFVENGKSYKLKQKFVVSRKNPIKSLSIDGKKYTKEAKTSPHFIHVKPGKHTLQWKLASGYSLIRAVSYSGKQPLETGYSFQLKRNEMEQLFLYLKDSKGHEYGPYNIIVQASK